MTATIIGSGLIGGSVALNLRKKGYTDKIIAVEINESHAERVLELGIADEVMELDKAVAIADLIVLAIPVDETRKLLPGVLNKIKDNAVVIDMGSTKAGICESVKDHTARSRFVPSHPIAGTENTGPEAAFIELFEGKLGIICEKEKSAENALKIALKFYKTLGMQVIFMDPEEHDLHVAYVSHLSHISSFMLGLTVLEIEKDEKNIFNLAGSGFASTVRLAKSSPAMWSPIFMQNSKFLTRALDTYIENLQKFKTYIENADAEGMQQSMLKANEVRRVLEGIQLIEDFKMSKEYASEN